MKEPWHGYKIFYIYKERGVEIKNSRKEFGPHNIGYYLPYNGQTKTDIMPDVQAQKGGKANSWVTKKKIMHPNSGTGQAQDL